MARDASRSDPASSAHATLAELGQLRERAAPPPGALCARARRLLGERFGPGAKAPRAASAFARGVTGLVGEHTHYSDGFALLMPLAQSTAVAARPASSASSRLAFGGDEATYTFSPERAGAPREDHAPADVRAARAVLRAFAPCPVEAAVVSAVPAACLDARLVALAAAAARAMIALAGEEPPEPLRDEGAHVCACLEESTRMPFSPAYVRAAAPRAAPAERKGREARSERRALPWVLADTAACESLLIEGPSDDEMSRGLVIVRGGKEAGDRLAPAAAAYRVRRRQAEEALRALRRQGFEELTAFRDLEHRDLGRALRRLSPALQPVVRHLITENRRVQKLVRAAQQGDWQFFGALLLMSYASLRSDWEHTPPPLDALVEAAEGAQVDGLYGACRTGRGPCVLVVGRPEALPAFFRLAGRVLKEKFGLTVEAMLL